MTTTVLNSEDIFPDGEVGDEVFLASWSNSPVHYRFVFDGTRWHQDGLGDYVLKDGSWSQVPITHSIGQLPA